MYGIDRKIQYRHKVENSEWSTDQQRWRLSLDVDGEKKVMHAKFVIFATGYYDYQNPLPTKIAGIENFEGKIIHPQFWPEDLDVSAICRVLSMKLEKLTSDNSMKTRTWSSSVVVPLQSHSCQSWQRRQQRSPCCSEVLVTFLPYRILEIAGWEDGCQRG